MYAVIRSGGKQYKVTKGERVRLDMPDVDAGASVEFEVLAVHDGNTLKVGTPLVESAKVTGKVLTCGRGRKIIVFRFKRRKGFHKKKGHRQDYTDVLIENVELEGKSLVPSEKIAEKAETPAKKTKRTKAPKVATEQPAGLATDSKEKEAAGSAKEGDQEHGA